LNQSILLGLLKQFYINKCKNNQINMALVIQQDILLYS